MTLWEKRPGGWSEETEGDHARPSYRAGEDVRPSYRVGGGCEAVLLGGAHFTYLTFWS